MTDHALSPNPRPPARSSYRLGRRRNTVLDLALAAFFAGAFWALRPLWPALLLAVWSAIVARPLHRRVSARVGGRSWAAAGVTILLVLGALAPLAVVGLSLFGAAVDVVDQLQRSGGATETLRLLLAAEPNASLPSWDVTRLLAWARQHGSEAARAAEAAFGAATAVVIGAVVFLVVFYASLVNGRQAFEWLLDHAPLPRPQSERLAGAFAETGRGLLISIGLTALSQGAVATVGYLLIGVPQALVLGLLTAMAALIPSVGTALVWVPVTIGLFLVGRTGAGIATLALGMFVSVVDNFVRPALSRYGRLKLPTVVVFVSMLGGIAAFGTWGLLLGPLFVRLTVEALRVRREFDRSAREA